MGGNDSVSGTNLRGNQTKQEHLLPATQFDLHIPVGSLPPPDEHCRCGRWCGLAGPREQRACRALRCSCGCRGLYPDPGNLVAEMGHVRTACTRAGNPLEPPWLTLRLDNVIVADAQCKDLCVLPVGERTQQSAAEVGLGSRQSSATTATYVHRPQKHCCCRFSAPVPTTSSLRSHSHPRPESCSQ